MKAKLILLSFVVLCFSYVAKAQEPKTEKLLIPEEFKEEIVRRILVFKFKPAKRPRIINLAKNDINPLSLPKIANIEFRLLSDEEVEDSKSDIYFFNDPTLENKTYNVGFAFGDPKCNYSGDAWNFRITNNQLRLWYAGRFGGGCGGFSGSDFENPGKLNTYPNELTGYKFFDQGRLKGLKITVSTKEDVEKIFGSDCNGKCDYDSKWNVDFNYFGGITKEKTINERKIIYVPKKELVGKVYSITFTPKQRIRFNQKVFPRTFNLSYGFSVGDSFDENGRLSAVGTSYRTYHDRYGLIYNIYSSGYAVNAEKEDQEKGDLISIEYTIPEKIEETTFVEEQ